VRPSPFRGRGTRVAAALVVALIWAGVAASVAGAHAIVRPGASRPAEFQEYTLTVPTERDQPTVGVVLKVPEGITFLLVENTPGWTAKIVRRNDRIDEIHWSGGTIPPDFFGTFRLIARNPVAEGEIAWRILQLYEGGETVRWIGGPDSASPAARTDITESAVPVDVVNVTSGRPSPQATGRRDHHAGGHDDGRRGERRRRGRHRPRTGGRGPDRGARRACRRNCGVADGPVTAAAGRRSALALRGRQCLSSRVTQ
jgi:uncharacterized protein YcnI